jgi:hypothetical protein
MIRLDSHTGEKEQILELLNHTINDSNLELECLINNSDDRFNPSIKHNDFISILKRYKGRPDFEAKESVRLAIDFPENSKYKGIRVLVKGLGAVNSYCNNENINLIRNSVDFEMKTKPKFKNTRVIIPNYNIKFNLKLEQNFNNDDAKINELLRDWNTLPKNFRYKKTFSFIQKTKDFQIDLSIVKSSTVIDRFMTVKDVLENNWLTYVTKPADAKTSFINWWNSVKDKPTEQVMLKNASSYHKTVKESGVFTNKPKYEVEVEYIKNKEFNINKKKFSNIEERKAYLQGEFVNFFKHIGSILQCIQGSLNIISNSDKADIKKKFIKVVIASAKVSFLEEEFKKNRFVEKNRSKNNEKSSNDEKKQQKRKNIQVKLKSKKDSQSGGGVEDDTKAIASINSDNELEYDTETEDESDTKIYGGGTNDTTDNITDDDQNNSILEGGAFHGNKGARGAEAFANQLEELLNRKGIFFGPLIVDLTHNNALQIDQSAIPDAKSNTNIHINYLVTDKTDGDRNLLFFDESGNVYGIDRENGIKSFGCIMPSLANSILDGEYISRSEEDKVINNFYIFDSYIYKGENVMHKPFLFNKTDGRHNCMIEAAKYASSGNNITQSNPRLPFILYKKDYLPSDSPRSYEKLRMDEGEIPLISENCSKLLNRMNVKYGGFLEVGHLYTYKTDGLVFLPNNLGVFQKSEDDYIKNPFISSRWDNNYKWKPADHLTIDFKIEYIKEMETSKLSYKYFGDKKYLLVNLLSKVWHNKPKDNNKLNFYLLNSGLKLQSIPEDFKFFATNPFIGTYDSEGELQNNMSEAYFEVDKNDNLVCENGDLLTNGIICECSYDRENMGEQFRWKPQRIRADKTAANAYRTANAAWSLINDPITKEQLCCLKENEKYNNDENEKGNDKEVNLETANYYTANKNMEVLTTPFNKFASHVKSYLIERWLTGYIKPKVLDLAVGKLGELHKYTMIGVNTLVGIDISEDSINNEIDGAATRMVNMSANNPAIAKLADKTMLLVGTAVKNIANGECVRDNINKYYLDVLYGRAKGNTPKLKKMAGVALDGFDMITCMYAIHYMFNNESDLDSFLQNVSENLLDQGYFIGTCLDGMSILKEMGRRNEIIGDIDGKTVFFIRKNDGDEAYKDITVGNKITVFYEKFAGYFPENLVNISYLKEKAKGHNLKLIEFRTFLEEPGNMLSQYGASNMKNERLIKQSEAMMTWAKFNCYFVFQKIRGKE